MVPPAPPRLSTTTCWPSDLLILSATMRPSASLPPPGGNGMTSVTGRVGYACAAAGRGASDDTIAAPTRLMKARRLIMLRAASQPANLGFIGILELRDVAVMAERERNTVHAGQQAFLLERFDFKPVDRAVRPAHRLRFKIDGEVAPRRPVQQGAERRDPLGSKRHRQQAILEAVVEEDVAEARRHHPPDAVIVERPHGVLARRPAAEIALRDHNAGIPVDVAVE